VAAALLLSVVVNRCTNLKYGTLLKVQGKNYLPRPLKVGLASTQRAAVVHPMINECVGMKSIKNE